MSQTQGQDKRPPPKPPLTRRKFSLAFTPAQGISFLAGIGILVAWAFVLGVLLGRGYAPENHIPELARLMPRAEDSPPPLVVAPDLRAEAAPEEQTAVLQPGDMGYRQTLKGGPPRTAAPTTLAAPQAPPQAPQNLPAFDYVYQVAAYKAAAPCDALVARLRKAGLSASTEKSTSAAGTRWYKILVNFRGTPDDVDLLREKLDSFQLNTLILRSKNPVQPKKARS
ncbi:MAG: SPOR domain-containing protein [Deltaproteobacteria bacterium]|jgi:hypothetical protein|nr:SPOR domain-containing protein [Deltaproteobacteria bacterium]